MPKIQWIDINRPQNNSKYPQAKAKSAQNGAEYVIIKHNIVELNSKCRRMNIVQTAKTNSRPSETKKVSQNQSNKHNKPILG